MMKILGIPFISPEVNQNPEPKSQHKLALTLSPRCESGGSQHSANSPRSYRCLRHHVDQLILNLTPFARDTMVGKADSLFAYDHHQGMDVRKPEPILHSICGSRQTRPGWEETWRSGNPTSSDQGAPPGNSASSDQGAPPGCNLDVNI